MRAMIFVLRDAAIARQVRARIGWLTQLVIVLSICASTMGCKEQLAVPPAAPTTTTTQPLTSQKTEGGAPAPTTRLRVAVRPFTNSSASQMNESLLIFTGIGFLYSPPAVVAERWKEPPLKTYVFDTGRVLASYLAEELLASNQFELVAFEPQNTDVAYDLIIDGEITSLGEKSKFPLMPIPLWIGSLVALAMRDASMNVEVNIHVSAPMTSKEAPVLRYGLSGVCNPTDAGCSGTYSSKLAVATKREITRFVHVLSSYTSSRTDAFWQAARDAASQRYYDSLDSELPALRREAEESAPNATGAVGASRAEAARTLYREKIAVLDMLRAQEAELERRWAKTSYQRIRDERIKSNAVATEVRNDMLISAGLAAASSTVRMAQASRDGESTNSKAVQDDLQKIQSKMKSDMQKRYDAARGELDGGTTKALAAELNQKSEGSVVPREVWLRYYRTRLPSLATFRATPIAVPEPPPPPPSPPPPSTAKPRTRKKV